MTGLMPTVDVIRYADLVLGGALNLARGQKVLLLGSVDHRDFIGTLAERAYDNGAAVAHAVYSDERVWNAQAAHALGQALAVAIPPWQERMFELAAAEDWAIVVASGGPALEPPEGTDLKRVAARRAAFQSARQRACLTGLSWCRCVVPSEQWALAVYGEPDVSRLWADLRFLLRLDATNPVDSWNARIEELETRALQLDEAGFVAVRFRGPGTELHIPLHPWARWRTANFDTRSGRRAIVNLPTEEVCVTPDYRGVTGRATATRPALIDGTVVEDLVVHFDHGCLVDVEATRGAEIVRAQITTDPGACRLGELALVDGTSRPGQLGRVFKDVIVDENATSHIAWGYSYPEPGGFGIERNPEECSRNGVNLSSIHQDVMIGSPEVDVLGVTSDGEETPIILSERWQLKAKE